MRHCHTTAVLCLAAGLPAQIATHGSVIYELANPTAAQSDSLSCNLRCAGAASPDCAFEHGWFYRLPGDPRELAFRDDGTFVSGWFGSHIDMDWGDVDARGLFAASLDIDVNSDGGSVGLVECTMTLRNFSNATLVIDLFNYVDLDVGGSTANEVIGDHAHHQVRHTASGTVVEYRALGNTHWDIGPYSGLELGLADAVVLPTPPGVLAGGLPPFAGDYTGAFQWHAVGIPPGGIASFTVQLCACMVEPYAFAAPGTPGLPVIEARYAPVQDPAAAMPMAVRVVNGLPAAPAVLMTNFAPAALVISGLGVHVAPAGAVNTFAFTNAAGEAAVTFLIPPAPNLTGLDLYHEWFVFDPGGVGGLASHTEGMRTTIVHRP